jgi:hypothetical protein
MTEITGWTLLRAATNNWFTSFFVKEWITVFAWIGRNLKGVKIKKQYPEAF